MPKINFKLSDDEKFNALWALLNPEFNEEGNWTVSCGIAAVYDDYALVVNYETGEHERAYYSKNDETDMVELGERVKVYIIDVTENEKNTLDTLRALNGGNYDLVNENLENAEQYFEKNSEFSAKIEELNETVATLNTEKTELANQISEFTAQIEKANSDVASLTEENNSLKEYKAQIEAKEKEAVIDQYSEVLSEDVLDDYRERAVDFTAEQLDKELAYELKKRNSSAFVKNSEVEYVPKDVAPSGLAAILSKYK